MSPKVSRKTGPQAQAGTPKAQFQAGQRLLCLHGSLLYEAKCMQVAEVVAEVAAEAEAGSVTYLIHYTGWNKNWDEWVPESRVLEYSEANLARQSELLRAHQEQQAGAKARGGLRARKIPGPGLQQKNGGRARKDPQESPGSGEGSSGASGGGMEAPPRKKRVPADPTVESRAAARYRVEVRVEIPEELKPWLVDDWDLVTKQSQLFGLPAQMTVDAILEDYARCRVPAGARDDHAYAVLEVVAGIREYFNVMLGTQLLYKFERPHYAEVLAAHPGAPMSRIYGAPHLLRLFVRIGVMLAYTPLDDGSLALLLSNLHDFLNYLAENAGALFSASDYGVAPPEYHRRAA
ncbi:mortality factor 4-like protein 1 [Trichosurus vulpecula]|uniref:mortality factor 4-like protein 1 n=1 Tax=Trichosurus vulpecula TaxID=9337 RepID=UPI00186B1C01|nr:mortality factor 4-like protein 1 [Trichosurus vulpecula]